MRMRATKNEIDSVYFISKVYNRFYASLSKILITVHK